MNTDNFIEGKFYAMMLNKQLYYFRFKELVGDDIISYGYFIKHGLYYLEIGSDNVFTYIYNESYEEHYEIGINLVVDYLPKNHPDIVEYRKHRINKLLSI